MKMIYPVLLYLMCLWDPVGVFGDTGEVKSVSVMEGESVALHTDVAELKKDDEIEWRFNGTRIAKANIPEYENDERFRDRLKLDQTGSLTITNTRTTDSGVYKLSIIAGNKEITKLFSVTVYVRPSTPSITPQNPSSSESAAAVTASGPQTPPHSPDSVPLTVLISAAAAGFLLIVVAVVIFWICWKKRPEQEDQTHGEEIKYPDPTFYKRNAQKPESEMTEVIYTCFSTEE